MQGIIEYSYRLIFNDKNESNEIEVLESVNGSILNTFLVSTIKEPKQIHPYEDYPYYLDY